MQGFHFNICWSLWHQILILVLPSHSFFLLSSLIPIFFFHTFSLLLTHILTVSMSVFLSLSFFFLTFFRVTCSAPFYFLIIIANNYFFSLSLSLSLSLFESVYRGLVGLNGGSFFLIELGNSTLFLNFPLQVWQSPSPSNYRHHHLRHRRRRCHGCCHCCRRRHRHRRCCCCRCCCVASQHKKNLWSGFKSQFWSDRTQQRCHCRIVFQP